ncbi:RNA 3'-terminal phosphate cyclase-like [Pollicipes pollicipes]|uniref:RNA 3'-terminal phosphate cyclase-like n=1 Tax=Pollicipes pollicipes TaxID=41117 RepID=UPI001884BB78|nr:RNA 3'-terminal phosphate cyclase-like [Pollicipes pollicipes]
MKCYQLLKLRHSRCTQMEDYQVIDGSVMEGGGQVLRMAISLSCLLRKPIRITSIRGGRAQPGLKAQHLAGLRLVAEMCDGVLTGDAIGSSEVSFRPGQIRAGDFTAETGTAGSVGLLLQVSLPCAMFAPGPCRLTLRGGTNAAFAPQIDYTLSVFRPLLQRFGGDLHCDLKRRGYFPRGGGQVDISVTPVTQLRPVDMLESGKLVRVTGIAFAAGKPPRRNDCHKAETAVAELVSSVNAAACVDQYCQDQCVILMALAAGRSRVRTVPPTLHTETAIHIAETLTEAKFTIEKLGSGDACTIECIGTGHQRA